MNRTPREDDTREAFVREETWAPPNLLPEPKKQEGYVYRYIRTAIMGEDDPMNFNRALREGWQPVAASEQPHLAAFRDKRSQFKDNIEIGGLLLCKCPAEIMKKRDEYYSKMTRGAMQSVDNSLMKENDSRMPLFKEGKTKVTFGSGG